MSADQARARAAAGWAGKSGLGAVVAGTAVLTLSELLSRSWWAGFWVIAAGVLAGAGCLVHGRLRGHERDQVAALVALVAGLLAIGVAGWVGYFHVPHIAAP